MEKLWIISNRYKIKFTKSFYDLPLHMKYHYLMTLPPEVLSCVFNQDAIVLSILQHSSPASKKANPCRDASCTRGERKISKIAKDADILYESERLMKA